MSAMKKKGPSSWVYEAESEADSYEIPFEDLGADASVPPFISNAQRQMLSEPEPEPNGWPPRNTDEANEFANNLIESMIGNGAEDRRHPIIEKLVPMDGVDLSDVQLPGAAKAMQDAAERGKHTIPPDIFDVQPHCSKDVCEHELDDGVKFAALYGELRKMREERDEWKRKFELEIESTKRRLGWHGDEGKVLDLLSKRLDMGANQYGALCVHDGRDMVQEGKEEALDLAIYLACELIRMQEAGE